MFLIVGFLILATMTLAHPQSYNCNGPSWIPGQAFDHMLVNSFAFVKKNECFVKIEKHKNKKRSLHGEQDADIPVQGEFRPGKKYLVLLTSTTSLGHKLAVEKGSLKPARVSFTLGVFFIITNFA